MIVTVLRTAAVVRIAIEGHHAGFSYFARTVRLGLASREGEGRVAADGKSPPNTQKPAVRGPYSPGSVFARARTATDQCLQGPAGTSPEGAKVVSQGREPLGQ